MALRYLKGQRVTVLTSYNFGKKGTIVETTPYFFIVELDNPAPKTTGSQQLGLFEKEMQLDTAFTLGRIEKIITKKLVIIVDIYGSKTICNINRNKITVGDNIILYGYHKPNGVFKTL